ncbi:MAG: hypothetical protein AB7L92_07495 [Alphaproteobacteria bacterium]
MDEIEIRPENSSRPPALLSAIVPQGMDLAMLGDIEKSYVVRVAKERMGKVFLDVATSRGSAHEKVRLFKDRAGEQMQTAYRYLEDNPMIPGGRTGDALLYVLAKSVMDAVEKHGGLSEDQEEPAKIIVEAVDGKPVRPDTNAEIVAAANVGPTNTDAVLQALFQRFHPAGGGHSRE